MLSDVFINWAEVIKKIYKIGPRAFLSKTHLIDVSKLLKMSGKNMSLPKK